MFTEIRHVVRTLAKSPGFTALAVLTLALGIGLSTSAFSLTYSILLRQLPYPESDRLVRIFRTSQQSQQWNFAPGNALDIRASATSFSHVALYSFDPITFAEKGQPAIQLFSIAATADFFRALGTVPLKGRLLVPEDEQQGSPKVALITERAWKRRFGEAADIINRTVRLNGEDHTIVGVLPASFDAPMVWFNAEIFRPFVVDPSFPTTRSGDWVQLMGRLKPSVSIDQGQSEISTIAARLAQDYPKENSNNGARIVDLKTAEIDSVGNALLWMMPALSTMVLIIACANLASLVLARALGRTREFAIRSALGASRLQLMRPLLTESLALAIAGGMLGLILASWSNLLLERNIQVNGEYSLNIEIDGLVLLFAVTSTVLSGIAFGLAPALLASKTSAAESLKEGSRGSTSGRTHHRFKYALIACELGFSLVLIGAAGSFALGSQRFMQRDLGWNPDGVFSGMLVTPWNRYHDDEKLRQVQRDLLQRLEAIPGVDHAAITTGLPMFDFFEKQRVVAEGQVPVAGQEPLARCDAISADYFSVAQIPLLRGNVFSRDLRSDSQPVVIVNEALARRFWPGEDPVGRRIRMADKDDFLTVIGVVGNVRMAASLGAPDTVFQMYRPLVQAPPRYQLVALRTKLPPHSLTAAARQAVASVNPDLPLDRAGSVRDSVSQALSYLNVIITNLTILACMGLLISLIGLYGVISHLTAQRTRDIGVRIALGASYGNIVSIVLRQGASVFAGGVAIGIPLYLLGRTLLSRAVPEMPFPGLWLPALILLVLGAAAAFASWLPAHRAARLDPLRAIHSD